MCNQITTNINFLYDTMQICQIFKQVACVGVSVIAAKRTIQISTVCLAKLHVPSYLVNG